MSQQEILEILEKYKKPMSRDEIARELCSDITHVSHSLRRLSDWHEIKVIELDRNKARELTNGKCKHRMRLYCIKNLRFQI
jgi:predicted transcriptional regulator